MANRYAAGGPEASYEPGSRGRVLVNHLGIKSVREMQRVESEGLLTTTERLVMQTDADRRFTATDIRNMHAEWLGHIYPWAGEYRSVTISRDGFLFAMPPQIARLMEEFENGPLAQYTPCHFDGLEEQALALAVVHAELILIHPFREGNGRCARLLATLMALQAGLPLLDFSGIVGSERKRYVTGIQSAAARKYEALVSVFDRVIRRTLRTSGGLA